MRPWTPGLRGHGALRPRRGRGTDIVQKEMFTFEDQGGRSLTLRPEAPRPSAAPTSSTACTSSPSPFSCWYSGPFFRHERPQAGRFRQFTQVGAEALGSDDPSLDAEVILLLGSSWSARAPARRLRLSSLGHPGDARRLPDELRAHLRAREERLSDDVRARLDQNPLRAFDSDHPGTRAVTAEAPWLLDRLSAEDAEHFAEVRALLDDAGLEYEVDPALVRGLDYYTRTVFEFTSRRPGGAERRGRRRGATTGSWRSSAAPDAGRGLGRWDRAHPARRRGGEPAEPAPPVYVALATPASLRDGLRLVRALRARGPARGDGAGRPLAQGPAQAGRPHRRSAGS